MPKKEKHQTICSQHNWILVETAEEMVSHISRTGGRVAFSQRMLRAQFTNLFPVYCGCVRVDQCCTAVLPCCLSNSLERHPEGKREMKKDHD